MKATLDHVGIAVSSLSDALSFYRDALGLEIDAPEEVASQRVRAHFMPVGERSRLTSLIAFSKSWVGTLTKAGPSCPSGFAGPCVGGNTMVA